MSETGTFTGEIWRQPYSAQQLQDAAANQIPIIRNGYWYTWDIATGLFVNSGVPADVATGKLNIIGKGINLLDNAHFIGGGSQQGGGQLPINERGQTSYTGSGYGINRWFCYGGTLDLESDWIVLSGLSNGGQISQSIANPSQYAGKTMTLSVLGYTSGGYYLTVRFNGYFPQISIFLQTNITCASTTFVCPDDLSSDFTVFFANFTDGATAKIQVAKLELGSEQTLGYQNSNGVWVPSDPPPNYGLELLKCATSRADPSDTYANKSIVFQ